MNNQETSFFGEENTKKKKKYYHLTTSENLETILKQGLIPKIGTNSKGAGHTVRVVYLTDEDSVSFWTKILDVTELLEIDSEFVKDEYLHQRKYTLYTEYQYCGKIPAKALKHIQNNFKLTREQEIDLCEAYLSVLNDYSSGFKDYVLSREHNEFSEKEKTEASRHLKRAAITLLKILIRLDYTLMGKEEIYEYLHTQQRDGFDTIFDTVHSDTKSNNSRFMDLFNDSKYSLKETKLLYAWIIRNLI